jgi:transcription antitermination factor NusB
MRRRTRAREAAIQFLYQLDLRGESALEGLEEFLDGREGLARDDEGREFAERLVRGTREHVTEIDDLLRAIARNWELRRMAVVDRNVLRMAVYELLHCDDIPPKVTINEAIELGKRFSTANSGAFINGILDRIRLDHVGERDGSDAAATPDSAGQ